PQQLIEYSLSAAPQNPQSNGSFYLWIPNNVDYDVSNVNYTYMPAAIGNWFGFPPPLPPAPIPPGIAWPPYVHPSAPKTDPPTTVPDKVPSALDIFLNLGAFNNTNNYHPAPFQSAPIVRTRALWEEHYICGMIKDVTALNQANYNNYVNVYNTNKQ